MKDITLDSFIKDLNYGLKNLNDDSIFRKIITESLSVFNLTELLLSEELDTSRPTVECWRKGKTTPHVFVREGIYKILLKKVNNYEK